MADKEVDFSQGTTPTPAAAPQVDFSGATPPAAAPQVDFSGATPPAPEADFHSALPPIQPVDHGILSRMRAAVESIPGVKEGEEAVAGPGTWWGTATEAGETGGLSYSDLIHNSPEETVQNFKNFYQNLKKSSLLKPSAAISDSEKANLPKIAHIHEGLSHAVENALTPGSIGTMLAFSAFSEIPGQAAESVASIPSIAKFAPVVLKAGQATLTSLGAIFSYDQLKAAATRAPGIRAAIAVGDTNKAIGMTVEALADAAMGLYGGIETLKGVRSAVADSAAGPDALTKNPENADIVHDRQGRLQKAGGLKTQLQVQADKLVPNKADQEWLTEYIEAGKDRKVMAKRQQEILNGPKPAPADQTKQVDFTQAADRVIAKAGDKEIGRLNTRKTGDDTAVLGVQLDPKFQGQGYGQQMYLEAAQTAKDAGSKYLTSDLEGTTSMDAARVWDTLKDKGYPVEKIPSKVGSPGYRMDLSKFEMPKPEESGITYRTDANGLKWANEPGSPAEVSVPKDMEGAEADKYAREKLDLQKQFTASRTQGPVDNSPEAQHQGQEASDLQDALAKAAEAKKRGMSPADQKRLAAMKDPNRPLTPGMQKYLDLREPIIEAAKKEQQKHDLLPSGHLRNNYVMHDFGYEDAPNSAMERIFPTYHDAEMSGIVAPNKAIGALDSDYVGKSGQKVADARTVQQLATRRSPDGVPLAVPGGYIIGQHTSTEAPKSYIMGEPEIKTLKANNQFNKLVADGRISKNANGDFVMSTKDFEPLGIYKRVPLGSTPIPPQLYQEMLENGSLAELEKKGLVYKNDQGKYVSKEPLYARVEMYGQPSIASNWRDSVIGNDEPGSGWFETGLHAYDYLQKNMKSLIVAWSPFHRMTETARALNAFGFKEGAKNVLNPPPDIDYSHPTPMEDYAIESGVVVSNPRGYSKSNVKAGSDIGEGVGVAPDTWGAKSYELFNKAMEKAGMPEWLRRRIDPQKILTDNVFGPTGQISKYKMAAFENLVPATRATLAHQHPEWDASKLDVMAGRETAKLVNNKFGGFNSVLAGRTLQDEKVLRRLFFAPDFLETTMRSVADLAGPYGKPLAIRMAQFQLAQALTAGAINYAMHRDPNDHSVQGAVDASHIMDHPGAVVSSDGKTVYSIRTAEGDFMHMLNSPRQFAYDRIAPIIKSAWEIASQRNAYGRKETVGESLKSLPKSTLPLPVQPLVGLGSGTISEPSKTDMFLKSFGIGGRPNRSDAENLALQKVSEKLQGQAALTGSKLVHQQLRLRAEDRLRDAYHEIDPEKKKAEVQVATNDILRLANQKLINPEEKKKIMTDAKSTRLASIFNSLTPEDALDVWDKATDKEKLSDLDLSLAAKYTRWVHELSKQGIHISNLDADNQAIFNRFRAAAENVADLKSERNTQTALAPAAPQEKASPAEVDFGAPPAVDFSTGTPAAPMIYKSGDLAQFVDPAAKRYGVDPTLIQSMIHQESGGNAAAVSPKGARGLMQLEPETAKAYGVTDIHDPQQNIEAGTHYMADLLKRYNGDEAKALAAYNAGPDAVAKYKGVPPFKETKDYVNKISGRKSMTILGKDVPGMLAQGNIDLNGRPAVHNTDGSTSTEFSVSFGDGKGREILVPTIVNGKFLTPDGKKPPEGKRVKGPDGKERYVPTPEEKEMFKRAQQHYEETGENMGIFDSPEHADAYATKVHNRQDSTYNNQ